MVSKAIAGGWEAEREVNNSLMAIVKIKFSLNLASPKPILANLPQSGMAWPGPAKDAAPRAGMKLQLIY
jgi:hypothetical protein